ncbi:MAG TPA: LysM peptidoglycan-binding domain-containing protein [Thermodesulfobacteriota bacterium]|nr:LysM peptidoglycan-binding domain-containing protein [Thermodesulfobacteriota bacterium]
MSLSVREFKRFIILFLSFGIFLLIGCAGPPLKQIKEAENALNNAYQKEAHLYAAEQYGKAKEKFDQIQKELERESFRKAKSLARQAKEEAIAATVLGEERKPAFAEKAKKVLAKAQEKWDNLNHTELKRFFTALYPFASDLMEGAKADYHRGDYYHASQKAKEFLIISEEFSKLPEKKKESLEKEIMETESLKTAQNKAKEVIDAANRKAGQMIEQAKKDAEKTVTLAREKATELWLKWLEKRFPSSCLVKKGETLVDISAKKLVYGDPFLWPLLYKANRDQIRDPQIIFSGQQLNIPRELTQEDLQAAREQAGASDGYTPPLDAYDPSQYQKELSFE